MAFHEDHLEAFITVIRMWTPESWNVGGILHSALVQVSSRFSGCCWWLLMATNCVGSQKCRGVTIVQTGHLKRVHIGAYSCLLRDRHAQPALFGARQPASRRAAGALLPLPVVLKPDPAFVIHDHVLQCTARCTSISFLFHNPFPDCCSHHPALTHVGRP